jgi:D-glycero-D-manno-heptose 1,7-bisphosphate phosphatase
MRPAVFFDLGWTLGTPPLARAEQFELYPEAGEAVRIVTDAGLITVIVSNQKSIASGRWTLTESEAAMERVKRELAEAGGRVDASYICPHSDEDACACRKPKTGMFEQAAAQLGIDVTKSWVVGDLWRDIVAGRALGSRTVQVFTTDRAHQSAPDGVDATPDLTAPNVLEAVRALLRSRPAGDGPGSEARC